jgi:hypothetical protein
VTVGHRPLVPANRSPIRAPVRLPGVQAPFGGSNANAILTVPLADPNCDGGPRFSGGCRTPARRNRKACRLKAGTILSIDAVFDNSAGNPNNPCSPPRDVRQGPQTTDEMLYGFMAATADAGGEIKVRPLTDKKNYVPNARR